MIVLTDHRTCERKEKKRVKEKIEEIKAMPVKLLPIAIGRNVNLRELQKINNGREVPMFGEYDDPEKIGMKIIHGMCVYSNIKLQYIYNQKWASILHNNDVLYGLKMLNTFIL